VLRLLAPLVLAAAVLAAPPLHAEPDQAPEPKLVHRAGDPGPGATIQLQVELRWLGRPERHLPGRPEIDLPRGATARIGRTSSKFNGEKTRWWTDVIVELPERGTLWTLGPARVPLEAGRLAGTQLETGTVEVGRPSRFRQLLAQGLGNGAIVVFLLIWVGWRWRSLAPAPIPPERLRLDSLLDKADPDQPAACLETLLEARELLGTMGLAGDASPTADEIRDRLEATRFGGESIEAAECRDLLTRLEAASEETR
jgi:hypothetical protein